MSKAARIRWFWRMLDAINFFSAKTTEEREKVVKKALDRETISEANKGGK